MLLISTAAVGGLTALTAPAASAEPAPAAVSAKHWDPPRCRPVHVGRDWRWDGQGRGHWDHRVGHGRHAEWKHLRWDDHRCLPPHRPGPRR